MKNKLIVFSTIIIALISCTDSSKENATTGDAATVATTNIKSLVKEEQLAMKKDPVCGMVVHKYLEDTTLYNGKIYGFCGKGCKDEFLKNPEEVLHTVEAKTEVK